MFSYKSNNSFQNYLYKINPEKIFPNSSYIQVFLEEDGSLSCKNFDYININFGFSLKTLPISTEVEIIEKLEAAFNCLNTRIIEEFPELNSKSFIKILEKFKEYCGNETIIPQCYELIRIIRNKFQHDKIGGFKWINNELIIKEDGENQVVISLNGLNILVYLIWYSFKNNMNHLYNQIILNNLYYHLQKELKLAKYIEKDKKGKISYQFNGLVDANRPFGVSSLHVRRQLVKALEPEKLENGYKLRRLKTIHPLPVFDPKSNMDVLINCKLFIADYSFIIEDKEYLIPDEFFHTAKDGENVIITSDDLQKFIYIPTEISRF